jgi:RNA polymerase primary sigma factor
MFSLRDDSPRAQAPEAFLATGRYIAELVSTRTVPPDLHRRFKLLQAARLAALYPSQASARSAAEASVEDGLPELLSLEGGGLTRLVDLAVTEEVPSEPRSDRHLELRRAVLPAVAVGNLKPAEWAIDPANLTWELALDNVRLVASIALRFDRADTLTFADLVHEGLIGARVAASRFDPYRGFRFSTYASSWINRSIYRSVETSDRIIRVPSHVHQQARSQGFTLGDFLDRNGFGHVVSNKAPIQLSDCDPAEVAIESLMMRDVRLALERIQNPDRFVLERRFGFVGGSVWTLESIGRELGLTRERIRQLESRGLKQLRRWKAAKRLRGYLPTLTSWDEVTSAAIVQAHRRAARKRKRRFGTRSTERQPQPESQLETLIIERAGDGARGARTSRE